MAVTQQDTHKIVDVTACCVLLFVKCVVHHCDFLQFLYTFILKYF